MLRIENTRLARNFEEAEDRNVYRRNRMSAEGPNNYKKSNCASHRPVRLLEG